MHLSAPVATAAGIDNIDQLCPDVPTMRVLRPPGYLFLLQNICLHMIHMLRAAAADFRLLPGQSRCRMHSLTPGRYGLRYHVKSCSDECHEWRKPWSVEVGDVSLLVKPYEYAWRVEWNNAVTVQVKGWVMDRHRQRDWVDRE